MEFWATMSLPDLWLEIVLNGPWGKHETKQVAFEPGRDVCYTQDLSRAEFNCSFSLQLKDEWRFVEDDGTLIKRDKISLGLSSQTQEN